VFTFGVDVALREWWKADIFSANLRIILIPNFLGKYIIERKRVICKVSWRRGKMSICC
jgi:hypothetical protein